MTTHTVAPAPDAGALDGPLSGPRLKDSITRTLTWLERAQASWPDLEPLSTIHAGNSVAELYRTDLRSILQAAFAWMQLLPMFGDGTGLPDHAREAMQTVQRFCTKYRETVLAGKPRAPISVIDGNPLAHNHVAQLAAIVDFVDTVVRKSEPLPDYVPPQDLDLFTSAMLERLGDLEESVHQDLMAGRLRANGSPLAIAAAHELHRRAELEWPGLTPQQAARAVAALALTRAAGAR